MNTCPLITAGFLKDEITVPNLELTEKGKEALRSDDSKAVLLQVAGTCLMTTCSCIYKNTPASVQTRS